MCVRTMTTTDVKLISPIHVGSSLSWFYELQVCRAVYIEVLHQLIFGLTWRGPSQEPLYPRHSLHASLRFLFYFTHGYRHWLIWNYYSGCFRDRVVKNG